MSKIDELFDDAFRRFKVKDIGVEKKIFLLIKYVCEIAGWAFLQVLVLKGMGIGVFSKTINLLIDNEMSVESYSQTLLGLLFSYCIISLLAAQIFFIYKNIMKIWYVICGKYVMVVDTETNSYHITTTDTLPKFFANHISDDVLNDEEDE